MRRGRVAERLSLLGNSRFRLLFFATFGSGLGNWLALIALQVDVYDRTHSGWWVGALLVGNILPAALLGLLLGPLIDQLSRKRLMIGADLARMAVFVALPFANSPGVVVALAVVAGIGNGVFRPAVLAGLPNLVDDDQLTSANGLLQMVEWTTTAAGPLLGGAIVAAQGPNLAYWINAVTFAFSAALVAGIPGRLLQSERPIGRGHWRDLREGLSVVRHSRSLMCVLVVWSIVMVANGIVNVSEIFLARSSYGSGDFGFGLLWAGSGVGLVLGGLVGSQLIAHGLGTAYVRMLLVFAIGIAGAAAAPNVWVGAAAMVVSGFGNGAAIVANITMVQRGAPDHVRGRAFTVLMSVTNFVLGLAFIAAGPLVDAVGARWSYAIASVTISVGAVTAWQFVRHEALEGQPVPNTA
jgi:MFS family permease